jgi:fructosamine-3-kinase
MDPADRHAIETACAGAAGRAVSVQSAVPVAGGCIHACYRVSAGGARLFIKLNAASAADAFAAEADGLAALRAAGMRAPQPLAHGATATRAYLALELLELRETGDCEALGRQLAAQHRVRGERFGWQRDNYIGSTPQPNACTGRWPDRWQDFWRDRRLAPQLALAEANGYGRELRGDMERLMQSLDDFFPGYAPAASLLHGDLWAGNAGFLADGSPVVFDPAVYRGDREADLAMTELFGGFPQRFYSAYREAWPLDPGYAVRRDLYNLYHVLNHLNLFGGGYLGQARSLLRRLLAEIHGA